MSLITPSWVLSGSEGAGSVPLATVAASSATWTVAGVVSGGSLAPLTVMVSVPVEAAPWLSVTV